MGWWNSLFDFLDPITDPIEDFIEDVVEFGEDIVSDVGGVGRDIIEPIIEEGERALPRIADEVQRFRETEFATAVGTGAGILQTALGDPLGGLLLGALISEEGERAITNVGNFLIPKPPDPIDLSALQFPSAEEIGGAVGTALEPLTRSEQPTSVVDLAPPPDPGSISVELGTGTERARKRRARNRRRGGSRFLGAGLLVPRADVQQQTLGGF
jgi:hypothetical protein